MCAGKFALAQNQWLLPLLSPLGGIRRLYATVPFLSLIVFFAIYIGIINQRETWSRYVRFNAMQVSMLRVRWCPPPALQPVPVQSLLMTHVLMCKCPSAGYPAGHCAHVSAGTSFWMLHVVHSHANHVGIANTYHMCPVLLCCSLPGVIEQVLRPPTSGFGLTLYINAYNT
jgi:hypothetical protein